MIPIGNDPMPTTSRISLSLMQLLHHFVGAGGRDGSTNRASALGGLKIDQQFEACRGEGHRLARLGQIDSEAKTAAVTISIAGPARCGDHRPAGATSDA